MNEERSATGRSSYDDCFRDVEQLHEVCATLEVVNCVANIYLVSLARVAVPACLRTGKDLPTGLRAVPIMMYGPVVFGFGWGVAQILFGVSVRLGMG